MEALSADGPSGEDSTRAASATSAHPDGPPGSASREPTRSPHTASSPDGRSIFFVGDIHGCRDPLERLLDRAGFVPGQHRLIPLGDCINRGPDNLGVLRLLESLHATPILGNHEFKVLNIWRNGDVRGWLPRQSVSRDLWSSPLRDRWLEWIQTWPVWLEGEGWLAVHAGLHPMLPLTETPTPFLVNVRACDDAGRQPEGWDGAVETIPAAFRPWHAFYRGPRRLLYGHWARQGLEIGPWTRGLDTGCVYGRQLSGLWWPTDRLVQVPAELH